MKRPAWGGGASLSALTIVVVVVVVLALLAIPFVFWQYRAVTIQKVDDMPMIEGADRLDLKVAATVGHLNVEFAPLDGPAVRIYANVSGQAGFFGEASPLKLNVTQTDDVATGGRNMSVDIAFDTYAPWPYYSLSDITYTVEINRSLRTDLNLSMVTGGIRLSTVSGVVLEGLRLNATNEGAAISLNNGTVLAGDVRIRTATGGTFLSWNNLTLQGDHLMTLEESSGRIDARFDQSGLLGGNLLIKVKDTVGEVRIRFELSGDTSAGVFCKESIGEPKITNLGGFHGTSESFLSDNYPAENRFNAQVNSTLGSILVEGHWSG